jgi:hypothetical protein
MQLKNGRTKTKTGQSFECKIKIYLSLGAIAYHKKKLSLLQHRSRSPSHIINGK